MNEVTVTGNRPTFRDGCSLLDRDPEQWTYRHSSTLDMSDPDLMSLLKQVSPLVLRRGDIKPLRVHPSWIGEKGLKRHVIRSTVIQTYILASNAILSTYFERHQMGVIIYQDNIYYAFFEIHSPFEVFLNCQPLGSRFERAEEFDLDLPWRKELNEHFYEQNVLETIDFSNLEYIAVADRGVYGRRPVILIKTLNNQLIRKQSIEKFQVHKAYENISREFYQPIYDTPEKVNDPVPDLRNLIYWNPDVTTDENGEAEIVFYNADRPQTIEITVEGIGNNGSLGVQRYEYTILDKKVSLDKDDN